MERDPLLFFTHMLAHSAVICIGVIIQATPASLCHSAPAHEQRALRAAADMARLVQALPSLNCFKAHPFLPNPLATAVAFLQAQPAPTQDTHAACHTLLNVLRDMGHVNNLALDNCLAHE
jgi:hypothetical protein